MSRSWSRGSVRRRKSEKPKRDRLRKEKGRAKDKADETRQARRRHRRAAAARLARPASRCAAACVRSTSACSRPISTARATSRRSVATSSRRITRATSIPASSSTRSASRARRSSRSVRRTTSSTIRCAGCTSRTSRTWCRWSATARLRESLRLAGDVIRDGYILLIFPEGTRSDTGVMADFKPSLGYLAMTNKCGILPMYLHRTHEAMPKGRYLPKRGERVASYVGPYLIVQRRREARARQVAQRAVPRDHVSRRRHHPPARAARRRVDAR